MILKVMPGVHCVVRYVARAGQADNVPNAASFSSRRRPDRFYELRKS
jgi:hypothetical protein